MMATTYRFIEPLDVLLLRGNKLFGDPGSFGESLVPPWPSAAAGALRSLMLAADGVDFAAFARGAHVHPTLGTPTEPGAFMLTSFDLARRLTHGAVETLHALPADMVLTVEGTTKHLSRMQATEPARGLGSSAPLDLWPVLPQTTRSKAIGGHWLTQAGWASYLAGHTPTVDQLIATADLWQLDARVGVGLSAETGSADDGKLFSMQAVAFRPNVGFLASVSGAEPPSQGVLRFGGDGRGAAMRTVEHSPSQPDWEALARAARCRIVLTTPGLFADGWQLPNDDANGSGEPWMSLHGVSGRVACAAVPRAEVVSGWDLARSQPKPAERATPAGSVYWIDDLDASAEQLRKLADEGLWNRQNHNASRRAEGYNRFSFAAW